jgi:hypothetical protein
MYIWALFIPVLVALAALAISPWWLMALFVYPLQVVRIAARQAWRAGEPAVRAVCGNRQVPAVSREPAVPSRSAAQPERRLIEYK